jgi:O-antigen ligase
MKKLLQFAEQGFAIVCLMLYGGGPLTLILSGGASEGDGTGSVKADNSLIQLLFMLVYVVTFFLLVARWKKVLYVLRKDRLIWGLGAIPIVSIFWSAAPAMTITRSIAIIGTTLFGLYLSARYSLKQQVQLVGWMFGIAIVLSLLFIVALPKYGIMGGVHSGAWRGIWTHKNGLGKMMVLSSLIFLILAIDTKKNRLVLWLGLILSVSLLLLSRSSSSLLNLMIITTVFCLLRTLRWRYELMIPALIAIGVVTGSFYVWFTDNADALLGSVGKDTTLTGRTDLWPLVLEMIDKRPWLGYGYGAFWLGYDSESAYVWYGSGWNPPDAHNGFLDLWLHLGLLGLSLFLVAFWITLVQGLAWARLCKTSEGFWPVTYMTCLILVNLTESSLMTQNSIFWVLYIAVALSVLSPPEQPAKVMN